MPSNVRRYDKSCPEVWIKNTRVYKCFTCDSSQLLFICENCFIKGKHNGHEFKIITIFNSFCNCGDSSGLVFCRDHQRVLLSDISKPLHVNDRALIEFIQLTGIQENEAKVLAHLNQIMGLLKHSSDELIIKNYFNNSQANGQKAIKLGKTYSVYRKDHERRFAENGFDRQRRLLLWHGTKCANLSGILRHGFKLPINEKLMFGNGIYFADRVTKSCDYSDQTLKGFLLLCEVSLGDMYTTAEPKPYSSAPDQCNSIKGIGKYIPDPDLDVQVTFDKSIEVPNGKTVENELQTSSGEKISISNLNFNEYVVFDPKRVLIKFIVQFDWP